MRTNHVSVTAVAIALALALSSCAQSPEPDQGGTSILNVKRAVQLERNGFTGQISPDITASISDVEDMSVACGTGTDGLMRTWRSTALTELDPEHASKADAISKTLTGSYVAVGWTSTAEQIDDSSFRVTLTKDDSLAKLVVTTTEDANGDGLGATIHVEVTGPCVLTDGPGSDELAELGEG